MSLYKGEGAFKHICGTCRQELQRKKLSQTVEEILKQFKLLRFLVGSGNCCGEWPSQLGITNIAVVEIGRFALLANCWRADKTWSVSSDAECFHCVILVELRNAPSFVSLKKSQGSNRGIVFELLLQCNRSLVSFIPVSIGSKILPLQKEDLSASGLHSFHGFLWLNPEISPEKIRSEPGLVDSEEIHLD